MNLTVKTKIVSAMLLVGCISIGAIGFQGYSSGKDSLEKNTFSQLTALREVKKRQIEAYFEQIRNQVQTYSENGMIVEAMKSFKPAFHNVLELQEVKPSETKVFDSSVESYLSNEFLPRLDKNLAVTERKGLANYWSHDSKTSYFQYHYISNNKNEVGSKHSLDLAPDGSIYSGLHQKYHPIVRSYLEAFSYYDIFLVDDKTGHIVYSVFKEADYATSLYTGPYKKSNFARLVKEVAKTDDKNFVKLADFETYKPSYDAPAAFIASPIFDGEEKIGVLVFQMPIDIINNIMTGNNSWVLDGLGETGETYLIGDDSKMRSISRFLIENKSEYLQTLEKMGVNEDVRNKIELVGTSIGLQTIKTKAAQEAISQKKSTEITKDYRGINALTTYSPVSIKDVKWSILSKIDDAEVFKPIENLFYQICIWGGSIVLLSVLLSLFFARSITEPLRVSILSLKGISEGDLSKKISHEGDGEIGVLNESIVQMQKNLKSIVTNIQNVAQPLTSSSEELSSSSANMNLCTLKTRDQAGSVSVTTEQVVVNINSMASATNEMNVNIANVSSSALDVSQNMATVSSAVEKMNDSIQEIAQRSRESSEVAEKASVMSKEATEQMHHLENAGKEIGKVTEVIKRIAEQTNLLALNATIEAASAGEAGKGFAVVAGEIKELANQSAQAAEEIAQKIQEVQENTKSAVGVIQNVTEIIVNINDSVTLTTKVAIDQEQNTSGILKHVMDSNENMGNIAHSISEVEIGSNELTQNASRVANDTNNILSSIQEVNLAAEDGLKEASQVEKSSSELSKLAGDLGTVVGQFKV